MASVKPLAIIQARLDSHRLPQKMLQDVGGHPLLWWAWAQSIAVFGADRVVIACPQHDVLALMQAVPDATFFGYAGDEDDVLGRLAACAAWCKDVELIYRVTPDDFPAPLYRDGMDVATLRQWNESVTDPYLREHVGYLIHPDQPIEVNTLEDLEAARARVESHQREYRTAV